MTCSADIPQQSLRDEPRVFHARRGGVDEARHDDLMLLEVALLDGLLESQHVHAMPSIRPLHEQVRCLCLCQDRPQKARGHVFVVRPCVVAPADVDPDLFQRHVLEGDVQGLHVAAGDVQEFGVRHFGPPGVPAHGQIGAVHLQLETGPGNLPVFRSKGLRQGHDVRLVVVEVGILAEERHGARRRHRVEAVRGILLSLCHSLQEGSQAWNLCLLVLGVRHAGQVTHRLALGVQGNEAVPTREALGVDGHVVHVSCDRHGVLGTAARSSSGSAKIRDTTDDISNVVVSTPLTIIDDIYAAGLLHNHFCQMKLSGWTGEGAHMRGTNPRLAGRGRLDGRLS
mmetsp:Transcript_73450/g.175148  ORF Transcript_73450/g.175148 Transcript_73450/m.175148 type:complete len:340 (+) Transcript_73450:691-1710(+)